MNKLLNHLRIRSERLYITLKTFFKWLLLSGITGICCGVIGSLFHLCMEFATEFRTGHSFMVYFLPVAGLVIVFLYSICGLKNDPGTNIIITSIRTEGKYRSEWLLLFSYPPSSLICSAARQVVRVRRSR